jgi:hypothetical protein
MEGNLQHDVHVNAKNGAKAPRDATPASRFTSIASGLHKLGTIGRANTMFMTSPGLPLTILVGFRQDPRAVAGRGK